MSRARVAFTLIELLIVVAIIGVALAFAIPAAWAIRASAREAACIARARGCAVSLTLYVGDQQDTFPYFADQRRLTHAFRNGGFSVDYFGQAFHWPLVAREYLPDGLLLEPINCPASPVLAEDPISFLSQYPPGYTPVSGYWVAFGTVSDPSWWQEGAARQSVNPPSSVFRAVRLSEVAFPGEKGFVTERWVFHSNHRTSNAAAIPSLSEAPTVEARFSAIAMDGSSRSTPGDSLLPGFREGMPILETASGVLGRDFQDR